MKFQDAKVIVQKLLKMANIKINGNNLWDIQVHNEAFYVRVLQEGSLGLGETYMEGWWDCDQLDVLVTYLLRAQLDKRIRKNKKELLRILLNRLFNFQSKRRAPLVGRKHYDISNELYRSMLGPSMMYSCAYWKDAADLEQAQRNKLELICQKLQLKAGMRLLDIGCGWGSLPAYAAKNYGVEVEGITVSEQQKQLAEERCKQLPVTIRLQDYRDLKGTFDRIVSVGMFEHVGYKNYAKFMKITHNCLHDEGLFLLHTIGRNQSGVVTDPWIIKYIFHNGMLPSIRQIAQASEKLFIMEDWHNFGADYDKTLMAWHANFQYHWPQLKSEFDERFYRMWNYYLLTCAGAFRSRELQLWQIIFSKKGLAGGYQSIRALH